MASYESVDGLPGKQAFKSGVVALNVYVTAMPYVRSRTVNGVRFL